MRNKIVIILCACIAGLFCNAGISHAQFKEDIYATDPNIKPSSSSDPAEKMFSFKEYIGGLSHKNTLKIGTMFAGSVVLPGTARSITKTIGSFLSYTEESEHLPAPEDITSTNTQRQRRHTQHGNWQETTMRLNSTCHTM